MNSDTSNMEERTGVSMACISESTVTVSIPACETLKEPVACEGQNEGSVIEAVGVCNGGEIMVEVLGSDVYVDGVASHGIQRNSIQETANFEVVNEALKSDYKSLDAEGSVTNDLTSQEVGTFNDEIQKPRLDTAVECSSTMVEISGGQTQVFVVEKVSVNEEANVSFSEKDQASIVERRNESTENFTVECSKENQVDLGEQGAVTAKKEILNSKVEVTGIDVMVGDINSCGHDQQLKPGMVEGSTENEEKVLSVPNLAADLSSSENDQNLKSEILSGSREQENRIADTDEFEVGRTDASDENLHDSVQAQNLNPVKTVTPNVEVPNIDAYSEILSSENNQNSKVKSTFGNPIIDDAVTANAESSDERDQFIESKEEENMNSKVTVDFKDEVTNANSILPSSENSKNLIEHAVGGGVLKIDEEEITKLQIDEVIDLRDDEQEIKTDIVSEAAMDFKDDVPNANSALPSSENSKNLIEHAEGGGALKTDEVEEITKLKIDEVIDFRGDEQELKTDIVSEAATDFKEEAPNANSNIPSSENSPKLIKHAEGEGALKTNEREGRKMDIDEVIDFKVDDQELNAAIVSERFEETGKNESSNSEIDSSSFDDLAKSISFSDNEQELKVEFPLNTEQNSDEGRTMVHHVSHISAFSHQDNGQDGEAKDDFSISEANRGSHNSSSMDASNCLVSAVDGKVNFSGSDLEQGIDVDEHSTDTEKTGLNDGQSVEIEEQVTDGEQWKTHEESILNPPTVNQAKYNFPPEDGFFSASDLVWGKVRSHPWWPGQIFEPSDSSEKAMKYLKKDKDCFLVAYFGDRTFAWNDASLLKPFRTHFSQVEKQSNSEAFQNAVTCALEEVSRRVQLGLSCSCVSKEVYEKIKFQIVENTGIRPESSRREGIDKSSNANSFDPHKFIEYIKDLARISSCGADRLDLVIAKSQLLAFYRSIGYYELPEFPFSGGLLENDSTPISSHKRKHNLKDNVYARKREKRVSDLMDEPPYSPDRKSISVAKVSYTIPSPKQSFKVGDCIRRVASQLTKSPSILKCSSEKPGEAGSDVSFHTPEKPQKGRMINATELSPSDEMLNQLHLAARDPMKGVISNGSEEQNQEKKGEFQLAIVGREEPHHSGTRVYKRKRRSHTNHEQPPEGPTSESDKRGRDLLPAAITLNFTEMDYVPSEVNLNKMFKRFGPLKEMETEIDIETNRARVVFKRGCDAEVAFNSAGKFGIFGSVPVTYEINYSPLFPFKTPVLATTPLLSSTEVEEGFNLVPPP